jgi:hypothetical protein
VIVFVPPVELYWYERLGVYEAEPGEFAQT